MRQFWRLGALCLLVFGGCVGVPPDGREEPSGGSGGSATEGGTDGGGGSLSDGGAGGLPSGDGGSGGIEGLGGDAWLDDEASWQELDAASSADASAKVSTPVSKALRFPRIEWEACGKSCERTTVEQGYGIVGHAALDTVASHAGTSVWSSFLVIRDGYFLRRVVDLASGETITALRLDPTEPLQVPPYAMELGKSPLAATLLSNEQHLRILYDVRQARWELKLPWAPTNPIPCARFSLDSPVPVLLFGCNQVSMLASPSSNERTTIEESEYFGSGAGNAGLSVWSETPPGIPQRSRIRTWSPEQGTEILVESMPGVACGVAVSPDRVTGIRSGDPSFGTVCSSLLPDATIWAVSRNGGPVSTWQIPNAPLVTVVTGTTWGDYSAVEVLTDYREQIGQAERSLIWLIRLTDGRMRRLTPTPGHEWRSGLLALDGKHLYIGENLVGNELGISQILRYDLEDFDSIGEPLEP